MFCVHIQYYLWKFGSSAIQQLTGQQSHFLLLIPGDNLLYCHWYLGQICRDFIENRSRVFLQDIALDDQWSAASLLLKSTWISQQLTSHKCQFLWWNSWALCNTGIYQQNQIFRECKKEEKYTKWVPPVSAAKSETIPSCQWSMLCPCGLRDVDCGWRITERLFSQDLASNTILSWLTPKDWSSPGLASSAPEIEKAKDEWWSTSLKEVTLQSFDKITQLNQRCVLRKA